MFSRSDGDGGFGLISSEGLVLGKVYIVLTEEI